MEQIIQERRAALSGVLTSHGLQYALILGAGRDKLNRWIFGKEAAAEGPPGIGSTPTLPPFNRNNIYLASADGNVVCGSALVPHPTDAAQYPVLLPEEYPEAFGAERIGIVNPECMKKVLRDKIERCHPRLSMEDITDDILMIRAEKSELEVLAMRAAAKRYDKAFSTVFLVLREGKTEHDAAVEFRWRLAQLGASDQDLQTLNLLRLTSAPDGGAAASEPLLYPGRRFQIGDRINLSCTGYLPGGFSGALGRCFVMGRASEEAKKYWALAVELQAYAASLAVPGASLAEIAAAVNQRLAQAGLPEDHGAWIYGIGAGRYEAPRNTDRTAAMKLKAGMTLVIGPHICPTGKDPYQCEDVFVVTQSGGERLSATPQELVELF